MTEGGPLVLVGCGGHGRVVLDAALAAGLQVCGIIDAALDVGKQIFDIPVLGGDAIFELQSMADARWLNGIGANPDLTRRQDIFETLSHRFTCIGIQHPSVVACHIGVISQSVQLMAGVVLQTATRIDDNSVVNTGARIDHDCIIGKNCFVAPGVTLCGSVTLADGVFIGAAAVILPGISIGQNAVVGAGSVVTADVPAGAFIVGNPGKQIWRNGK